MTDVLHPRRTTAGRADGEDGVRSTVVAGLAVAVALVGGVGWWAGTSVISGAIIASGTVVVESNVKKVQQQSGGTVRSIMVRNGDYVSVGDVLVRLDDRTAQASLQIVSQQLDRARLRMARLIAETTGATELTVPPALAERAGDPEIAGLIDGERALLASDLNLLESKKAQLDTRNQQYREQIDGLEAQRSAAHEALALAERDVVTVQSLYDRKLAPLDRLTALQSQIIQQKGEIGRLTAAIAEAQGRISENAMIDTQTEEDFRKNANTDLRDTEGKEAELIERQTVAQNQLEDTVVRAPQDGVVQELSVHTIGGVVSPGETMMLIVPRTDRRVVDAQVSPMHIDEVHVGQPVVIRFSAFDRTTTPECHGKVENVSADLVRDQNARTAYYLARIDVSDEAVCLGGDKALVPGMPTELHIQTGDRTVWSYIFKPLTDQMMRAMRE
jgi:HlyD family secretion protein